MVRGRCWGLELRRWGYEFLGGLILAFTPFSLARADTPCVGVLVDKCYDTFKDYINALLTQNFPYVLLIALVMIVFSGVQYMTSGFTPEAQKTAKQRIYGILAGLIFYLLIQLILRSLSDSIPTPSTVP